ncbi:hypothetical protein [Haliangium sp.]|uniref:hypothetical protein n=1 Tax=Haliangium sp. TaxID=2663208 RepID=UPI003D1471A6
MPLRLRQIVWFLGVAVASVPSASVAHAGDRDDALCIEDEQAEPVLGRMLDRLVDSASVSVAAIGACRTSLVGRFSGIDPVRFTVEDEGGEGLGRAVPWLTRPDAPLARLHTQGRLSAFSVLVEALLAERRMTVEGERAPPMALGPKPTQRRAGAGQANEAPARRPRRVRVGATPVDRVRGEDPGLRARALADELVGDVGVAKAPHAEVPDERAAVAVEVVSAAAVEVVVPAAVPAEPEIQPEVPAEVPAEVPIEAPVSAWSITRPATSRPIPSAPERPARVQSVAAAVLDPPTDGPARRLSVPAVSAPAASARAVAPAAAEAVAEVEAVAEPGPSHRVTPEAALAARLRWPDAVAVEVGLGLSWHGLWARAAYQPPAATSLDMRPLETGAVSLIAGYRPVSYRLGGWQLVPTVAGVLERVTVRRLDVDGAAVHAYWDPGLAIGGLLARDLGGGLRVAVEAQASRMLGRTLRVPDAAEEGFNRVGARLALWFALSR